MAFPAIIGGLGSIYEAILGGFLFAGLQTVGTVLLPFASAYKDVFAFAVVIAIMAWRPTGLIQERSVSGSRAMAQKAGVSIWPGVFALAIGTAYLIALLAVEKQALIIALLVAGIAVVVAAAWFGLLDGVSVCFADHEDALGGCAIIAALVVAAYFHDNHFVLLLINTVLLYSVATLGLNVQFGYAGVLNFAGASFFGIGAYTPPPSMRARRCRTCWFC